MTTMSPIRGGVLHLPTSQEGRYSQSLERGLAILRAFSPEHPWLGIAEIAEQLEMSRPTTHRYASTLVALNYLEQGRGRKYRLGMRAGDPGRSAVASTAVRKMLAAAPRAWRCSTAHTSSTSIARTPPGREAVKSQPVWDAARGYPRQLPRWAERCWPSWPSPNFARRSPMTTTGQTRRISPS